MNEQYNDSSYSFLPSCDGWCAVLCWSIIMVPISIWQLQSSLCLIQSDQRTSWVEKAGCGQQQKRQHPVRGGGLSTREINLTPKLSSNKIAVNSMHSSIRSSFKQSENSRVQIRSVQNWSCKDKMNQTTKIQSWTLELLLHSWSRVMLW